MILGTSNKVNKLQVQNYEKLLIVFCSLGFFNFANADEIKLSFDWGDIPLCTSGKPNTVSNPVFTLSGIPKGAKWPYFKMKDRDVPNYNHGVGRIELKDNITLNTGNFNYESPCSPTTGGHTYQWTIYFTEKKSLSFSEKPKGVII
ncbi:MAG: hypothetical protein ACJZ80_00340 [Candidatus Puniceispirillales bacterium]